MELMAIVVWLYIIAGAHIAAIVIETRKEG